MPQSQPDGIVYVIGAPGSATVKIGRTGNLRKRFADIRTMSPVSLEILWAHPGDSELEANLHRHFADLRSHGEWFTFTEDPVSAISAAVEARPWKVAADERLASRTAQMAIQSRRRVELRSFQASLTAVRGIEDPVERIEAARAVVRRHMRGDSPPMRDQET